MLKALPDDFGLCDQISATSSAESFVRSELVGRSESVGRRVSVAWAWGKKHAGISPLGFWIL